MKHNHLNYIKIINNAMVNVIKKILRSIAIKGIPNNHSLYINFNVKDSGLVMPEKLKTKSLNNFTITIQNLFKDLEVNKNDFKLSLSIKGKYYEFVIPFSSIISFHDPQANFYLEMDHLNKEDIYDDSSEMYIKKNIVISETDNVINIANFRDQK